MTAVGSGNISVYHDPTNVVSFLWGQNIQNFTTIYLLPILDKKKSKVYKFMSGSYETLLPSDCCPFCSLQYTHTHTHTHTHT